MAKQNELHVSTLKSASVDPIVIECWNAKGVKSSLRTDAAGARKIARMLDAQAEKLEKSMYEDSGYERVRRKPGQKDV